MVAADSPASKQHPAAGAGVHEVTCPSCHGEDYVVLDEQVGLLRCRYCRNTWIDERFIKLSETERYLREQAKQPRVLVDNSSETDRALMGTIMGAGGLFGRLGMIGQRALRGCLAATVGMVALIVLLIALQFFGR
ncbi:MAG: hypothetical protein LBI64_03120 [Coriobacteriales bacterium]|jgi:ribosomal protein L37AE/L43A|nr:hypothetical protein [Coriobacteriales bacterium]